MATFKLGLLYRDADNYKGRLEVDVNSEVHPSVASLKVGDDITMGEFGYSNKVSILQ